MIHKMWYLQILQVTWVQWSQWNESVTGVDLWKKKAKRKPRKTKKKQPFHIVSSPVYRGDKHASGVKSLVKLMPRNLWYNTNSLIV